MTWIRYLITVFAVILTAKSATNDVDKIIQKRVRPISNQQVEIRRN